MFKIALSVLIVLFWGSLCFATKQRARIESIQCPVVGLISKSNNQNQPYLGRQVESIEAIVSEATGPIQYHWFTSSGARILDGDGTPKINIQLWYWA